ncbi:hypothetical protein CHS0354_028744 [Potamilus streckersoni]|uniref:Cytochrome P450 n=1 Tax=Potamilus streckersoni TaxID=2493646 RepID=A0AAE0VSC9_9BIVA|nr:hypothetical protein CHS0354_028744 [Potamilus streckersoni]
MEVLGLFSVPSWLMAILLVIALLLMYTIHKQRYFKRLDIPGPTPIPFLGHIHHIIKKGFQEMDMEMTQIYGNCYGTFFGNIPQLIVTDPEMIKQLLVKQFSEFTDRPRTIRTTKFFDSAITVAQGEHWKFLRATLSPTFSSNKMRNMTPLISKCLDSLIQNVRTLSEGKKSVEMRELFGAFTMDAICCTGFGLQVESQSNPDDPFIKNAKKALNISVGNLKFLLAAMFPELQRFIREIPILNQEAIDFFIQATKSALADRREAQSESYRDFLQLMINAHQDEGTDNDNGEEKDLGFDAYKRRGMTDAEVLANAIIFFLAAFDTTSNLLTFASYCLATNQDVQDRLRSEINKELGKSKPTYDNVFNLTYLDMTVNETLRMYSPAQRLNRMAVLDTTLCGVKIPKGLDVTVSVLSLHYDTKYWENPHKFDPERFSPENKDRIHPFTFLPFGGGPRNCIGMRLALMETKMAIAALLQNYRILTSSETEIPPKIDKRRGVTMPENGLYLKLEAL